MIYYLWKINQFETNFVFIEQSALPNMGFSSLYGVSEIDAKSMMANNSYSGFKGTVYPGERLWIDCDTETSATSVEATLKTLGLDYEVWGTGNRGLHFGVKRNLSESQHVPEIDKEWVKKHCPEADLRLYTHLHLFRRPGAIHEKTGLTKHFKNHCAGNSLFLEYSAKKAANPKPLAGLTSVFSNHQLLEFSTIPYQSGTNRRRYLSRIAVEIAKTGNPKDFALVWLLNVNLLGDSLEESDIARIVDWAYSEAGVL